MRRSSRAFFGIRRNRLVGDEVQVALDREAELAAHRGQFDEADVAELRLAHAEIAETEGEATVRVEFRQKPGTLRVWGEEFEDGFEVDCRLMVVHRGAERWCRDAWAGPQ